jgi:hypothetical protein
VTNPAAPSANFDARALRAQAEQAKAIGQRLSVRPDDVLHLLDSHDAALRLADVVEELRAFESGKRSVTDDSEDRRRSATELRNRWRRQVEDRGLRLDGALAAFRSASRP